jgi:nitrogen fixation protein NifU and related proteins
MTVFSPLATDHIQRPRNAGRFEGATHVGCSGVPGDGPYVQLWLRVEGDTIVQTGQESNGCPSTMACASLVSQLALGRQSGAVKSLEAKDLILVIGGLPEGKEYSADLAVSSLQIALNSKKTEMIQ